MRSIPRRPDFQVVRRAIALVLLACGAFVAAGAHAEEPTSGTAPATGAGLKVNVDPQTGRFLETPARDADPGAAPRSADDLPPLEMVESPVPGGGTGFRVPDQRFNAEMRATATPAGSASVACDVPAK